MSNPLSLIGLSAQMVSQLSRDLPEMRRFISRYGRIAKAGLHPDATKINPGYAAIVNAALDQIDCSTDVELKKWASDFVTGGGDAFGVRHDLQEAEAKVVRLLEQNKALAANLTSASDDRLKELRSTSGLVSIALERLIDRRSKRSFLSTTELAGYTFANFPSLKGYKKIPDTKKSEDKRQGVMAVNRAEVRLIRVDHDCQVYIRWIKHDFHGVSVRFANSVINRKVVAAHKAGLAEGRWSNEGTLIGLWQTSARVSLPEGYVPLASLVKVLNCSAFEPCAHRSILSKGRRGSYAHTFLCAKLLKKNGKTYCRLQLIDLSAQTYYKPVWH